MVANVVWAAGRPELEIRTQIIHRRRSSRNLECDDGTLLPIWELINRRRMSVVVHSEGKLKWLCPNTG